MGKDMDIYVNFKMSELDTTICLKGDKPILTFEQDKVFIREQKEKTTLFVCNKKDFGCMYVLPSMSVVGEIRLNKNEMKAIGEAIYGK